MHRESEDFVRYKNKLLFYTALARPSTLLNFLVCHNQNPVCFPNLLIYTTLILSHTETTFLVFHTYIPVHFPYLMCMKTARSDGKLHHLHRPQICIKLPWILKGIKLNTHSRHMRISIDGTSIRCESIDNDLKALPFVILISFISEGQETNQVINRIGWSHRNIAVQVLDGKRRTITLGIHPSWYRPKSWKA